MMHLQLFGERIQVNATNVTRKVKFNIVGDIYVWAGHDRKLRNWYRDETWVQIKHVPWGLTRRKHLRPKGVKAAHVRDLHVVSSYSNVKYELGKNREGFIIWAEVMPWTLSGKEFNFYSVSGVQPLKMLRRLERELCFSLPILTSKSM